MKSATVFRNASLRNAENLFLLLDFNDYQYLFLRQFSALQLECSTII